jgi:hypothetical protein
MSSPESPPWGFLQWAVAGLASIGASAAAFVWRLMTRLDALEKGARQQRHDLDVSQSANETALLRLAERRCCTTIIIVCAKQSARCLPAQIFMIWSSD